MSLIISRVTTSVEEIVYLWNGCKCLAHVVHAEPVAVVVEHEVMDLRVHFWCGMCGLPLFPVLFQPLHHSWFLHTPDLARSKSLASI